jgi:hypothetical protein
MPPLNNATHSGSAPVNGFAKMPWTELIPASQWAVYKAALRAVRSTERRFLLGGAFGLAAYTLRLRNTKDLDLFVLPEDRDAIIAALSEAGFVDFYDQAPYDRGWIFRSIRDEMIVDVIWKMPNRRGKVDPLWFEHAKPIQIHDEPLYAIPAEELLWAKLYVLQRDRCDWPDLINLLNAVGPEMDWNRVLDRLADDAPLLRGLLSVFVWLCPGRARDLSPDLFQWLELPPSSAGKLAKCHEARTHLLDSRPWFAAFQEENALMKL